MFHPTVRNGMTTTWTYNLAGQSLTESYSGGTLSGYSVSRTNDNAMRVGRVQLKQGANVLAGARYGYDTAGRLQAVTNDLAAGQVVRYAFDDIGNRTATGGRASAVSAYTRNYLNQYGQRTVAAAVDVLGVANPGANVTVNGNVASRKGEYFHYPLTAFNSNAQYPAITAISQYGTNATSTGKVYVAPTNEVFQYDADGNLTSDGRWAYTWDGENRLIAMTRDVSSPTGARQRLEFEYDAEGRRIRKLYLTNSGGGFVAQSTNLFLYDGWNLIGELNGSGGGRLRTYIWGTDLSGTMAGAGGVGGLLLVADYTTGTTNFVAYDGNGNVVALTDAASGAASARYDYGPFGESLRATGPMATNNPIRFSTKYTDNQSGFLYYGFRYYNPSTGRWISRDPVDEEGFKSSGPSVRRRGTRFRGRLNRASLYAMVRNNAVESCDYLGLAAFSNPVCPAQWDGMELQSQALVIVGLGGRNGWKADLRCTYQGCRPDSRTLIRTKKEPVGPEVQIGQYWISGTDDGDGVCVGVFEQPVLSILEECWGCERTCRRLEVHFKADFSGNVPGTVSLSYEKDESWASQGESGCRPVPGSEEVEADTSRRVLDLTCEECASWGVQD